MSTISFTATGFSAGTGPPHTISGVSFGAAAADRVIAVALMYVGSDTFNNDLDAIPGSLDAIATSLDNFGTENFINSVTIGGVAASKAIGANPGAANQTAEIWYAAVPTGTTGSIVVNSDFVQSIIAFSVYRLLNVVTSPTDTDSNANAGSATISIPGLTIPTAGVAVLGFINGDDVPATVWTNATADIDDDIGVNRYSSATRTTAGLVTITADGGNAANQVLVGAAWGGALTFPSGRNIGDYRFR